MPRVSRSPSPRDRRDSRRRDDRRDERPFAKKPINSKGENQISIFVRNLSPHTKYVLVVFMFINTHHHHHLGILTFKRRLKLMVN
jgi:hypothetical protein